MRYWVIGDTHGQYFPFENFYNRNKEEIEFNINNDVIIVLGDFGGNYYLNSKDDNYKKKLQNYPFTYFIIRGNHEERPSICQKKNPKKWHIESFLGNLVYVENNFPFIKYALDKPAFYQINKYKTLIIPGAYSVDKYYRLTNNWQWFKNEQLTTEEMEGGRRLLEENNWTTDIVLSHTCPIIYEPTDLFISNVDQSLVDKTMERYLGEIEYKLEYKCWLWGHYHDYREYPVIANNNRKCIMLSAGKEVLNLEQILTSSKYIKF